MSYMIRKGIVFKMGSGTIFIVDRVLDMGMDSTHQIKAKIMAKALTKNCKEYVQIHVSVSDLQRYIANLTEQDINKLSLLGIKVDTKL